MSNKVEDQGMAMRLAATWKVYTERRVFIMLLLGFSSGLPFLLVFGTLSLWLREADISRTDIGLMSYVGLVYTIKFAWAPVLDRLKIPVLGDRLGRRRAWMIAAQAVIAIALVGMSFCHPATALMPLVFFALLLAFASATQDIAIDAWRIEAASDEKQGAMAASYQLGYRFALIASGAGALFIAEYTSWHMAYLAMALLMGLGMAAAFMAPRMEERPNSIKGEEAVANWARAHHLSARVGHVLEALYSAVIAPFVDFFGRYGWKALLVLGLIGSYRVPDFVMGVMANPLYVDAGFSKVEIGTVVKLFGIWMTIGGAIVGGLAVAGLGTLRAMFIGAVALSLTNFMFAWLAAQGNDLTALTLTISSENFAGGFAGTCLIAFMSSLTNREFTATQYALFSSVYALPGKLLGGQSGRMVDFFAQPGAMHDWLMALAPGLTDKTVGYAPFFVTTGLMGLPAILLLLWFLFRDPFAAKPDAAAPA